MDQTIPPHLVIAVRQLRDLTADAEKTGDFDQVTRHIDQIIHTGDLDSFPEFAATMVVERCYAVLTDLKGVSPPSGRRLMADLASARVTLQGAGDEVKGLVSDLNGMVSLLVAVNDADSKLLKGASEELARSSSRPRRLAMLCDLSRVHAGAFALTMNRVRGRPEAGALDLNRWLRSSLKDLVASSSATRYRTDRRLAYAYHVVAAMAYFELWLSETSGHVDGTLDALTHAFTFMSAAVDLDPGPTAGGPFAWPHQLAVVDCQIIVGAAMVGVMGGNAEKETRRELEVFLERVRSHFAKPNPEDLRSLGRSIGGLISSHRSLMYGIFGRGRAMTGDEEKLIKKTLAAATAPAGWNSAGAQGTLLLEGLASFLRLP